MTHEFEVGDKVRVLAPDVYSGRCGVVVNINDSGLNYLVRLDLGNNDMQRFYRAEQLDLWTPEADELTRLRAELAQVKAELVTFAIVIDACVNLTCLMANGYDTENGNALLKRATAYMKRNMVE